MINVDLFHAELERASLEAFRTSTEQHRGEQIYCAALYTSSGYEYVCDTLSTAEGLDRAAEEYLIGRPLGTKAQAVRALKWSPCDSPYHLENEHCFERSSRLLDSIWAEVRRQPDKDSDLLFRQIHDVFIAVLKTVRASNVFAPGCLLTLLAGDQSNEARIVNAEEVNAAELCRTLEAELEVDSTRLSRLRSNRWPSDGFYEA